MLCPLWPLCGSSCYTHGTYCLVSSRQKCSTSCNTFQHTHTAFMILSTIHFFSLWPMCGLLGPEPERITTILWILGQQQQQQQYEWWVRVDQSDLVVRAPSSLVVVWIQCSLLHTGLKICQLREKNSQERQEINVRLVHLLGVQAAKGSVHPNYQRTNFTTHPWWYLAMQIAADRDFWCLSN